MAATSAPTPLPAGSLAVLGSDRVVAVADCTPTQWSGARLYHHPDTGWLAPAFRSWAVALGQDALPDPDDEAAAADLILRWVEAVRAHDWSTHLRGAPLQREGDWVDLRTAMVRAGWGPAGATAAWEASRARPYSRELTTAAGWAGAGWVVPAVPDEIEPAFARPVLEARGLLRWVYITRWGEPTPIPESALPVEPDPRDSGWAELLSRLRQDHYPQEALEEAEALAVEVLTLAGLGPRNPVEAEDEPLADRNLAAACGHASPVVRAAAWLLLRAEADAWLACAYGECQHHWAVEAEEDAYEQEEVLELAGYGVANPLDAAYQRRRLLTLAFGDINDVPLAGAGDVATFVEFYNAWTARGRSEEEFQQAVRDLRADDE